MSIEIKTCDCQHQPMSAEQEAAFIAEGVEAQNEWLDQLSAEEKRQLRHEADKQEAWLRMYEREQALETWLASLVTKKAAR